jgi:hypothetical protein|tara:strand:- start:267 stop:461 length:195 start_codon:yes stop_codon:yes gene_type:complete
MKDGIYRGDAGATYFVLNEKIMMKMLGQIYKTTKHFTFSPEYYGPLTNEMKDEFEIVYNKADKW